MCEAPSIMLEVERRECHMKSKWSTFYLRWKLRGVNFVQSPNCMEVEVCAVDVKQNLVMEKMFEVGKLVEMTNFMLVNICKSSYF